MGDDVYVLLLGATTGAYALARSFAEDYAVPVTVMDEQVDAAFEKSNFVREVRRVPGIMYPALLHRALSDFYEAHSGRSLLLLPLTAAYAKAVLAEREFYERMFLLPQKTPFCEGTASGTPEALLLAYRGREGALTTAYGRVVARDEDGSPLALVTAPTPVALLEKLTQTESGFALYAVDEKGNPSSYLPEGAVSPFCALASAQDTSLAEWVLFDYVLCREVKNECADAQAVFSLLPYRAWRKRVIDKEKKTVAALRKKHLHLTLFTLKNERKSPFARARLRRFYRGI